MKKKILPIPLILLIPIVMLVVVIVAGLYRFSLTDEEILAKFPSSQVVASLCSPEEFTHFQKTASGGFPFVFRE